MRHIFRKGHSNEYLEKYLAIMIAAHIFNYHRALWKGINQFWYICRHYNPYAKKKVEILMKIFLALLILL